MNRDSNEERRGPEDRHPYLVGRRDQLESLTSPVRQEIVDVLQASGPASIAEVAGWLGRAADSLYYHIRRLVEVGLVIETDRRRTGRRDEAIFDVVGRPLRVKGASPDVIARTIAAVLRLTDRDLREALEGERCSFEGSDRNTSAGRMKGWLTTADALEVHDLLERIGDIFERGRNERRGRLQAFTFALVPLAPSSRADIPTDEESG